DLVGQVQQAQQVRDMAAAFVERLGQTFLRVAETVHQLAEGGGLFDRVQIGALDVFDQRDLEHLGIVKFPDQDRQLMQLRNLGSAPATFARDDLVEIGFGRVRPNDQRLQDTAATQGSGQLVQRI